MSMAAIDAIRTACLATQTHTGSVAAGAVGPRRGNRRLALAAHRVDVANAYMLLGDTEVTFEALDQLAAAVSGSALNAVLRWAAASCAVRRLASGIQDAATRISGLVKAVKGFTNMDQAMVAQSVDLRSSLGNTVAVLRSKAREKSVAVSVEVEGNLPHVRGYAGELNQIWGNLIDNALDAVPSGGRIDVLASRNGQGVVVRVIDNGPAFRHRTSRGSSTPSSRPSPWGKAWALGWILSAAWCVIMTLQSKSSRIEAVRSFV